MKIYFVTSKLNFERAGGSVADLDLRARAFQDLGNEVNVITVFSGANHFSNLPYNTIEKDIKSRRLPGIQRGVLKVLRAYSNEADIFYIDGQYFYAGSIYRKLGGRVPTVACFNRELLSWPQNTSAFSEFKMEKGPYLRVLKKKLRWLVEKYIGMPFADGLDLMTFTSPFLKKAYSDFGLKTKDKSLIVGDCFDYKKMMGDLGIAESDYQGRNKKDGVINLFYSGRMVPGKGFELLLSAFSKVKNKNNFKLILGGTGSEEEKLKRMVRDLDLGKFVEMPGWVEKEKVYDFYRNADIFIQPKWRGDMTSISLLEAMTFGLPSILPGEGGLEWVARKSAVYFKDNDAESFARRIEELGSNQGLRAELSRNCYIRIAEDDHDYRKQISIINDRLKKLL